METTDWALLLFVALQVGVQSAAVKRFGSKADRCASVLSENLCKLVICLGILPDSGLADADPYESAACSLLPAGIYAVAGVLKLRGYENTTGVTFNTMNQTKLVFTAILAYAVLGKVQGTPQLIALCLVLSAAIISARAQAAKAKESKSASDSLVAGVLPCVAAAVLSSFASVSVQYILQNKQRNTFLYSAELSLWGSLLLLPSMSLEGLRRTAQQGPSFIIPPFLQACGGIAIGILIQRLGSVAYGFSTVLGLLISAIFEPLLAGSAPSTADLLCLPLVIASTYLFNSK
eukprot:TRINITY_DN57720_c0_g1_i1.p1 TRINITY_DN57720_c0_g1~~TRINITY_DN57720_c0_g1_i1.p1  ORF type:complete len:290 (+),score=101.27 TRINITY_DN57720_c0_g1_i1:44-913(+)